MANNTAIVVQVNKIDPHPNADNLAIAKLLGTQVIVAKDTVPGTIFVYVDSNMKLSEDFLKYNNLYKHSEKNFDITKSGFFEDNGRVKCIKLRGEISDGFLFPFKFFSYIDRSFGYDSAELSLGMELNSIDGVKFCEKYIVPVRNTGGSNVKKVRSAPTSKMFVEHIDTDQFYKNIHKIPSGTLCYIVEKVHGTSGRIALALIEEWEKQSFMYKLLYKLANGFRKIPHVSRYGYITGSRRVVLDTSKEGYHDNRMRYELLDRVRGLLPKGMQLYFEIYGYDITGAEIQKGFSYGCNPGTYKARLYRMTMNNEDGYCVDMPLEYVINFAAQINFEAPEILCKYFYSGTDESKKNLEELVFEYSQGQSTLDPETLKEGVIVQYLDECGRMQFLKYKQDAFRLLESGNKDKGIVDIEDMS